jgi:transitional endoplasmic reticulum ATPase
MDGLEELKDITIIGATNRPDMLDTALLRPGRFDRVLLVPGPSKQGRLQVLKIHTRKMPIGSKRKTFSITEKEKLLTDIAEKTDGYVGADLENLAREAAMIALREDIGVKTITKEHFDEAMKKVKPSVTKKDMEIYTKIEEQYLKSAKAAIAPVQYLG